MKNLIVGQSGGPTAVINSSLYGVIREGFNRSEEIEHAHLQEAAFYRNQDVFAKEVLYGN